MRFISRPALLPSCLVFIATLSARVSRVEASCIRLTGIESGGGEGLLDLDKLIGTLETNSFSVGSGALAIGSCSTALETPVAMRHLLGYELALFTTSNMYHPSQTALDVFGDKETSDARRRCQPETDEEADLFELHQRVTLTYVVVYGGLLDGCERVDARYYQGVPSCREEIEPLMEAAHVPLSLILDGAEASIETPWGLAKAYVEEIYAYLDENDGWNSDGGLSRDYNRVPYSDYAKTDSAGNTWTPYVPKNSPYHFTHKTRWQPLMESDGLGYISTQEHVVPHIGATARFFGFNSTGDEEAFASRKLSSPQYTYRQAADGVLEESRLMATDDYKQAAISFFDNKATSLIPLKSLFFLRYLSADRSPARQSIQDFAKATAQTQLVLYNSIILSWKEKVRHDRPRPPTVVTDQLGDTLVETYAGLGEGVQNIKASEWEPFIRTMPHSEFPSASACMCEAFARQLEHFLGSDTIDPALEFPVSDDVVFTFSSWTEMSTVCGDSRSWGGMHFPESIPAGADLCGDARFAESIAATTSRLIDGDETAAVLKRDPGELMVRSF